LKGINKFLETLKKDVPLSIDDIVDAYKRGIKDERKRIKKYILDDTEDCECTHCEMKRTLVKGLKG
jgi:hypothetical protein